LQLPKSEFIEAIIGGHDCDDLRHRNYGNGKTWAREMMQLEQSRIANAAETGKKHT